MDKTKLVLNELLVEIFNDILMIEQNALQEGPFKDLTITEMHTIEAIGMYEPRTMSDVAAKLRITVGTLTTAVNNLVKKEYVERKRIQEDRRVVLVQLTKKGKLAFALHQRFHEEMIAETVQGLSQEEQQVLIHSLKKLNVFFKEHYEVKQK